MGDRVASFVLDREPAGECGNGVVVEEVLQVGADAFEFELQVVFQVAVQSVDAGDLAATDEFTHLGVMAFVQFVAQLGLADDDDREQFVVAVLQFPELFEGDEGGDGQFVAFFDHQAAAVAVAAAGFEEFFDLARFLFRFHARGFTGYVQDDSVAERPGVDFLLVENLREYGQDAAFAADLFEDPFPDGAFAAADLPDNGQQSAVFGGVQHGRFDVAVFVGHVDVAVVFHAAVGREGVPEEFEVFSCLYSEHFHLRIDYVLRGVAEFDRLGYFPVEAVAGRVDFSQILAGGK